MTKLVAATQTDTAYTPSPTPSRTNTPPSTETFTPTATNAPTVTPTPIPSEPAPQALTGAQYAFDGDGTMMRGTLNGLTTFYPGRHYNKEVNPGATKIQKFYFAGTITIAVRTLTDTADTLTWVLGDHLGSASTTANENGTLNSVIQYTAFGEIRLTQRLTPTKYRYTGQLAQAELGLDFYVSRMYDPLTAHFTSADTLIPEPGKSQSWDKYSYVFNNPVKFNDPSGNNQDCGIGDPGCRNKVEEEKKPPECELEGTCDEPENKKSLDTDNDGIPNKPDPSEPPTGMGRGEHQDCLPGNLVECFYDHGVMPSGDYEITSEEYFDLLLAISLDIDKQKPIENYGTIRKNYDTPFYDTGDLKGVICVTGMMCRSRQELNYIAQGMWSAAANEGKIAMIAAIVIWKKTKYSTYPSLGTLRSANEGYDFYMLLHPKLLISSFLGNQNHYSGFRELINE